MDEKLMIALGLNTHAFKEGINEAKNLTRELGEKFKETGLELASALGLGLAAFKGFELIKEGMEEYKKINIQSALLTNELKNQGKYSAELVSNLKEGRELLSDLGFYKEGEQLQFQRDMQKYFPNANNAYREEYTTNAANIAAAKGVSLAEGQAVENKIVSLRPSNKGDLRAQLKAILPELGENETIKALPGIMKALSEGANSYVNHMTHLLAESHGLKNAAKVAAEANPDLKFNKAMEEFTVHLGELGIKIKKAFLPDMEEAVKWLDDIITNHAKEITDTLIAIGHGLEFVLKHIEALGIAFAAKKLIDGVTWITEIFSKAAGHGALTATALMNVNAEIVNINSAAGLAGAANGIAPKALSAAEVAGISATTQAGIANAAGMEVIATLGGIAAIATSVAIIAYEIWKENAENAVFNEKMKNDPQFNQDVQHREYESQSNIINKTSAWSPSKISSVPSEANDAIDLMFKKQDEISKNVKKGNAKVETPNANVKGGTIESQVKGAQSKQIIININKDLVGSIQISSNSLAEGADEIERVITRAILDGLQAGELLYSGGH